MIELTDYVAPTRLRLSPICAQGCCGCGRYTRTHRGRRPCAAQCGPSWPRWPPSWTWTWGPRNRGEPGPLCPAPDSNRDAREGSRV